jgi:hypothetical protein
MYPVNVGYYGQNPVFVIAAYMSGGNGGSGQNGGQTPEFAPGFAGMSPEPNGVPGGTIAALTAAAGQGGNGGGVNADGTPGVNGLVIIWWGDD